MKEKRKIAHLINLVAFFGFAGYQAAHGPQPNPKASAI